MIILTGNSLNDRHRELNSKVNEAMANGVQFDDVKSQIEKTDIDRIYKIDLANKCKNVAYIIETLKCGDSLYITRAFKSKWLYDDELSNIVNPDYLEQNIFPEMSFKMKRKFLTLISQHVENKDRAALFYIYCMKIQLPNIALKFLFYTTEAFKLEVIEGNTLNICDDDNMVKVIGNSLALATAIIDKVDRYQVYKYLKRLFYLYSVSDSEYLDLVEKYISKHKIIWEYRGRIGLRISKNIIKKHKDRLFRNTKLYFSMLNKKMLVKHSSVDEVKKYLALLLPSECPDFWSENFYDQYKFIINVIPVSERFQFIKDIFISHYPGKEFEMDINFYDYEFYKLLTKEERESWALKHIENGLEHFGHGQDFRWYKFVSFGKALEPIKKYILSAANADVRTNIIKVLVSSAQSDRDLEELFNYYYQRFVNERINKKGRFIDEVLCIHNYFNFDEDCWNAFDKILHSMDVYDNTNSYSCRTKYKLIAIVYAISHEKELHEVLKQHIDEGLNIYTLTQQTDKLSEEKASIVYQYVLNLTIKKINDFNIENYNDNDIVECSVKRYIHRALNLMEAYNKQKSDIPDIVMNFVKLDMDQYNNYRILGEAISPFTQFVLIKDLKKDASLVVSKIPLLKNNLEISTLFNVRRLLRKVKIYFSTDIAVKYIDLYQEILTTDELYESTYDVAVYGILLLADKDDLVKKYIPTEPKIDHTTIERNLLYIRKAICKYVCISRPVVPLTNVKKYIVGDYLKFCLPMFQSYASNLQPVLLMEFVKFLLKSPTSIQKHGIRLAFQCFSIKDLKTIVSDIWRKTKNVSLRLVMYRAVQDKIKSQEDENIQKDLFEALKAFTLDLREDDDDEVFTLMNKAQLPTHILGEYILSVWQVLNTLPHKQIMNKRKASVVDNMAEYVSLMQQDVVESIVDKHIKVMLKEEEIKNTYKNENELIDAKWNLTSKYLMHVPSKDVLERKVKTVGTIIKECVRLWDHIDCQVYTVRQFLMGFIKKVESCMRYEDRIYCLHEIELLKQILKILQESLPLVEIYDKVWYLRSSVIAANIIIDGRDMFSEKANDNKSLIVTEYIKKFAKEFASLVNEFIEGNIYYISALSEIKCALRNCSDKIIINWLSDMSITQNYICFEVCSKLVEIEKFETYRTALELLPVCTDGEIHSQVYRNVVRKIKNYDNNEIKYLFNRKFVRGINHVSSIATICQ